VLSNTIGHTITVPSVPLALLLLPLTLTAKEKERRFKNGLCYYCGGSGHIAPHYQLASRKKQTATLAATKATDEAMTNDAPEETRPMVSLTCYEQ
jgi:hypothetical protein